MQMKTLALALALIGCGAQAETVNYEFAGTWHGNTGSVGYTGSFSIVDPVETQVIVNGLQWEGISTFYSGGTNFNVTFANGATAQAATFDIRVNNVTQSEAGAAYPLGLTSQFSFHNLVMTNAAPLGLTGMYMAFWRAPEQTVPHLPDYSTDFEATSLGIFSGGRTTMTDTVITQVPAAPVPEPESWALMLAGLGVLGFVAARRKV